MFSDAFFKLLIICNIFNEVDSGEWGQVFDL